MNTEETNNHTSAQPENQEPLITEAHQPDMGEQEPPTGDQPVDELGKARHDAAEWKDKYMRLYAEFDNFRKRSMKEKSELLSTASGELMKELLPVVDDFDRAVQANAAVTDIDVVREGFVLIHQKLYKKLESKGLKPIDAKGKPFDTDYHEAITQMAMPDMAGKVVDEVEKGYTLHEKVIRYSKVVIGQ
ncbi:MAG: nucleotide exchange factor GrpE [Flavobacteriales bacterium]